MENNLLNIFHLELGEGSPGTQGLSDNLKHTTNRA